MSVILCTIVNVLYHISLSTGPTDEVVKEAVALLSACVQQMSDVRSDLRQDDPQRVNLALLIAFQGAVYIFGPLDIDGFYAPKDVEEGKL